MQPSCMRVCLDCGWDSSRVLLRALVTFCRPPFIHPDITVGNMKWAIGHEQRAAFCTGTTKC